MSRILVVEDDVDMRELYLDLLTEMGHEAVGASDGVSGLELAETLKPELVISDWRMPRMDGAELCKQLRRDDRFRDTRIILHSSEGTPVSQHADMCLRKLSDPEGFRRMVETALSATRIEDVA
ncbi:response regulator [Hyalangium versicolor]|uniref:response regulator n=1 Tax=Hyalangium versicolor TaxID=2861190 RepID=UPI001CCD87A8|nr:response regulator [Hyalangium versicolor]